MNVISDQPQWCFDWWPKLQDIYCQVQPSHRTFEFRGPNWGWNTCIGGGIGLFVVSVLMKHFFLFNSWQSLGCVENISGKRIAVIWHWQHFSLIMRRPIDISNRSSPSFYRSWSRPWLPPPCPNPDVLYAEVSPCYKGARWRLLCMLLRRNIVIGPTFYPFVAKWADDRVQGALIEEPSFVQGALLFLIVEPSPSKVQSRVFHITPFF